MTKEKEVIRISVRNLVEFILRSGDIDGRREGWADKEAMAKGSRIHRKIQGRMGGTYRAEVPLSCTVEYEEFSVCVEGRADGIFTEGDLVTIDEIKGVYRDLFFLEEPVPIHLAQARCYACIYGKQNGLDRIRVQMTYCQMETEEIRRFEETDSVGELAEWFGDLMEKYYAWALWRHEWRITRNASMEGLEFPFPYREGQREVVAAVYQTIRRKKQLFIQAPTGVGKTMSTIYPAVRSMGEGLTQKLFYLTAKTVTRTVAWEAFGILKERGLRCKVLAITAKEKLCVCGGADCDPAQCPRAKGHYDRVNACVFDLLQGPDLYDRGTLLVYCEKYCVCPYETCLDVAIWADAVICDYNYVLDPDVRLRRFFGEGGRGDYIFLIDEAHNLVERGREMYSAALCKEDFLQMKKLVKPWHKKLTGALDAGNRQMLELKRECADGPVVELKSVSGFALSLLRVMAEMEDFLEQLADGPVRRQTLDFYFQVRNFLFIYELVDENYLIYGKHDEVGHFWVCLSCVNPAENLQKCLDKGVCAVFFSATLLPIAYYRGLLSGRTDDYAIYARTPFEPEQKCLLIGRDVSSRYARRGPAEYARIAAYIHTMINARVGNYMVFFPSYRMMEDVGESFGALYPEEAGRVLMQDGAMPEAEREEYLAHFEEKGAGWIGFCVMGGIFAEGIDLVGERLVGVAIVGTGLPQIGPERELLKKWYDRNGENGFDYAYRFPGMNKVLQAAGRLIRTQSDRGVILLLDDRFGRTEYRNLFPGEWENWRTCTQKTAAGYLDAFWKREDV